jgi:hypothetical protein
MVDDEMFHAVKNITQHTFTHVRKYILWIWIHLIDVSTQRFQYHTTKID